MAISNKIIKLLIKLLVVFLLGNIIFVTIVCSILGGKPTFNDSYPSVIQRKYDKLISTEGPKIVIIGGSNVGFGINSDLLTEQTGYTTVSMGLYAGFGQLFNTEIAKNHIKEGDILLLAYEYGISSGMFEQLGDVTSIMSAIDNNLYMYKEIPLKNMGEVLGNLYEYAQYKAQRSEPATGVYSSSSFDELGNMTLAREACTINDYYNNIQTYGRIYAQALTVGDDKLEYLVELKELVESKGASIYFIAPVVLFDSYEGTEQDMLNYARELEQTTGIKYISNPYDYLFSDEYMFDFIYHCNTKGEIKRSELIVNDLRSHGIIK